MKFLVEIPDNDADVASYLDPGNVAEAIEARLSHIEAEDAILYFNRVRVSPVDGATEDEVSAARERHALGSDSEIEIDGEPAVSRGDDGVWVAGWLFVPNEILEK